MEHHVRNIKWNVKHMNSGANENYIQQRSTANGALADIAINFDSQVHTVDRYENHSHITAIGDIQELITVLEPQNLLQKIDGRTLYRISTMPKSLWDRIDNVKMNKWLSDKIEEYAFELGN
jgi:hypothetical protein